MSGILWSLALPSVAPPLDASLDGHRIDDAFRLTTYLTSAYFALVVAVLAFMLLRYRARSGHRAVYTHGSQRRHILVTVVLALTVFLTIDMNLVRKSHADMTEVFWNIPAGAEALRVEVFAQQFAWNIRYAGPDARFGTADDIATLNEMHVPVGRPVAIQLAAKDVIHSFYLPNFRIKQDAMPGMVNRLRFQAKQTGEFDIGCAQHCGVHHYKMKGRLTVLPRAAWEQWAKETSEMAARGYDPDDKSAHWGWDWRAL